MADKDREYLEKLRRELAKKDAEWHRKNEALRKKVQEDIEKKARNKRDRKY